MIQKIEELSMNALPSLSTVLVNGWVLRFANGYSKRANSINPIYPVSVDVKENIELCSQMFKMRNLDTVFKLTELEDALRLDKLLEDMGYTYKDKTNVMIKSIENYKVTEEDREGVIITSQLTDEWFKAFTTMNKISQKNSTTLREMLLKIIPSTYYCSIFKNGKIVAVGLGVAERGYVGIFDVYVNEEHRRKGLGNKIMKNLLYHASRNGCSSSYLQVVDSNEGAKYLYEKLGYKKIYSYWYRIKGL